MSETLTVEAAIARLSMRGSLLADSVLAGAPTTELIVRAELVREAESAYFAALSNA